MPHLGSGSEGSIKLYGWLAHYTEKYGSLSSKKSDSRKVSSKDDTAEFPHSQWTYYHSISQNIDLAVTTNSLENLNLKLKRHLGHGFLSSKNALRKLKSFQEDQISLYTTNIVHNKMNKIKP